MTTTFHTQSPEPRLRPHPLLGPRLRLMAALLLGISSPPTRLSAQQAYRIGPRPAWVNLVRPDLGAPAVTGTVTYGYDLLLIDRQESVTPGGLERYRHMTFRLLNQGAVEDLSQVELSLDPTYEQLVLHSMNLIRDGKVIDQLKPGQIRVVQREGSRDYHVFNGTVSVVLVLEGVRVGDLIEYSYTRVGANPVFAGHYYGSFSLQESVPVRELRFRLLWPPSRQLNVHQYRTSAVPAIAAAGDRREYLWTAHDLQPKLLDDDLPDWYDAFPSIRLSDFPSWKEVAAWGDTLFASPGAIPAPVKAEVDRIRRTSPDPETRALAALRYAQEQVRYLGVEIGANSHRPFPLATVIQRGYGDCKDKAQLLVAMLHDLGIPAWPALVSTAYREHLAELHPTSVAFDHAIVQAEIDGKPVWLDPTDLYQRGDLRSVAPQYGSALVLGRGSDSLTPMARVAEAEPLTEVKVDFDLDNIDKPVTMRIETDYRGRAAVNLRATSRSNSLEKMQKDYTEYYASSYPGILPERTLQLEDNEATNLVHTSERYTVPRFWHEAADGSGYIGTFDPAELGGAIATPVAAGRTMPLAVWFPVHYRYTLTAHLVGGWNIQPERDSIESSAMRFVRTVDSDHEALTIGYEYQTLADHVDSAAAADHLEKVSRVRRLLTYSITPPRTSANKAAGLKEEGRNWPLLLAGLLTAAIAAMAAVLVSRSSPPSWATWPGPPTDGPAGLGGWLYLVGFGVALTPLVVLVGFLRTTPSYGISSWAALTTEGQAGYHPLYAPLLLVEMVVNILLVVFGCLQAWFFFGRKRWFPVLFVLYTSFRLVYDWVDLYLADQVPALHAKGLDWSKHASPTIIGLLWVAYMFKSRRVRNTFVN